MSAFLRLVNIARIRAQMVRVLEGQHIELPMSTVGAIHAIQANLIAANIAITELKPKYMRGYGAVGSSQQEKTAIRYDLGELNHWQDTVEV
ncbi:hypothetical protein FBB35_16615 [Nostoc sp. TCL240-02]|nr:hypothetical protein FBB35_16615 [Nostoc sp. TCL240-02]